MDIIIVRKLKGIGKGESDMAMYQASNKEKFIKQYESSRKHWQWFFAMTFTFEQGYGKDLFDFDKYEVLEMLSQKSLMEVSVRGYLGWIRLYENWAIENNLKRINRSAVGQITDEDIRKISKKDKEILKVDTVYNLVGKTNTNESLESLLNPSDRLMIYLSFLGVTSYGIDVLLLLKKQHVDFDNKKILLSNIDESYNDIAIDDFGLDLIKKTTNSDNYYRYLTYSPQAKNNIGFYKLVNSDYIFRRSEVGSKGDTDGQISKQTMFSRIKTISEYMGVDLSFKGLEKAGSVYVAKTLLDAGYKLKPSDETLKKVLLDRFGVNTKDKHRVYQYVIKVKKLLKETYPEYEDKI